MHVPGLALALLTCACSGESTAAPGDPEAQPAASEGAAALEPTWSERHGALSTEPGARLEFDLGDTKVLVRGLAAGREGLRWAAACSDDRVRVFVRGEHAAVTEHVRNRRGVNVVALRPDGGAIASSGPDRVMLIGDGAGDSLERIEAHERPVIALAVSRDGTELVSADTSGEVRVWAWDGRVSSVAPSPRVPVRSLALDDVGERMLWSYPGGVLRIWDSRTGEKLGGLRVLGLNEITELALRGSTAACGSAAEEGSLRVFDLATERRICAPATVGIVRSIALHPSERELAVGLEHGCVRVFDARTGAELIELETPGAPTELLFTPDGDSLLAGGYGWAVEWGT